MLTVIGWLIGGFFTVGLGTIVIFFSLVLAVRIKDNTEWWFEKKRRKKWVS